MVDYAHTVHTTYAAVVARLAVVPTMVRKPSVAQIVRISCKSAQTDTPRPEVPYLSGVVSSTCKI